jgi:hypothetical protein
MLWNAMSRGENGDVRWDYSINGVKKSKTGNPQFNDKTELVNAKGIIVTKNQIDKAFFLLYKSVMFKKGFIYLEDFEADADNLAKEKTAIADAHNLIWSSTSPLTEEQVRTICRAYDIKSAGSLTLNQLKLQLDAHLAEKYKNDKTVYGTFVSDANMSDDLSMRAIVNQALENKVIYIDYETHAAGYINNGEKEKPFYNFLQSEFGKELECLIDFLATDEKGQIIYNTIVNTCNQTLNIDLANPKAVREFAKSKGIKVAMRKQVEILEDVQKYIEEHKR